MKKIHQHYCAIDHNGKVHFSTAEYICHNFDSKTAKNYVIQTEGEHYKRHIERDRIGKVSGGNLSMVVYFFEDPEHHKQLIKEAMEKRLEDAIQWKEKELEVLKNVKLEF